MNTIDLSGARLELDRRHNAIFEALRDRYFFGCKLRILVVADYFLYFNDEDFGLSELVSTLRDMSTSLYPVFVDLAHRDNPGASRLAGATPNFVFTEEALRNYDQIWIMAAETGAFTPISQAEQQAIRAFMDGGGGVFATGDHEDLGVTVGGYIPRVRSMRKWFWPSPGPNGEPVAPHGGDATRHDTNRPGHDPGFTFDDQSDDIPQTISPTYFGTIIQSVHPVLCGPRGPIRVLPDHPHEGECVEPNTSATYTIGGDTFAEYPDGPSGDPLAPAVIATSTMIPGAEAPAISKPPIAGGDFGAIGAWDGHRAGDYGRIVVDATWHHFINVNLIGSRSNGPPNPAVPKTMGFLHSEEGLKHLNDIKTYYRNIANWLTPRSMRRCLSYRSILMASEYGGYLESVRSRDLIFNGSIALQTMGVISPCHRYNFIFDLPRFETYPPWFDLIDPFSDLPIEKRMISQMSESTAQRVAQELPAAIIGAVAEEFRSKKLSSAALEAELKEQRDVPKLAEAAQAALPQGLATVGERLEKECAIQQQILCTLR